jgi:hypothetical protein
VALVATHRRSENVYLVSDLILEHGHVVDVSRGVIHRPWPLRLLLLDARWNLIEDEHERQRTMVWIRSLYQGEQLKFDLGELDDGGPWLEGAVKAGTP